MAARPERSGVIPDMPKQLPSNQQVLSTPLSAQARAWNNNKVNVPTHQANASTNHAYVPSVHVNDVPISHLHQTNKNRHTETIAATHDWERNQPPPPPLPYINKYQTCRLLSY